uniref:Uncharacterized protein n=1 Tax=Acrobeloides nanus TaxID=290746 RepID=A0A914CVA4_9BILA
MEYRIELMCRWKPERVSADMTLGIIQEDKGVKQEEKKKMSVLFVNAKGVETLQEELEEVLRTYENFILPFY